MSTQFALTSRGAFAAMTAWQRHLAGLALVAVAILLLFARDVGDMAWIWWNTSTFSHCLLIVPIIGWLVWHRRAVLAALTPAASRWGLAILGLGALSWLLGEAAGVATARHLGVIVMLQGAVVAMLGLTVARGLLFPLCYALFLVPFGEELVPALQMITADLCMTMLGWLGIPAHIEGVFITTPNGYFEVAEACAGAQFLIAMIAFAALAGALCFQSWTRRLAFLAVAIVVPVIANGFRAAGTIWVAETIDPGFAESFDHIVYGWFFFAFVIAIVTALGWPFFDRAVDAPAFETDRLQPVAPPETPTRGLAITGLLALAITLAPIAWTGSIAATARGEIPADIALPDISGWERVTTPMVFPWRAAWPDADMVERARYRDLQGRVVDLAIGFYAAQDGGRELVGYGRGGREAGSGWSWVENAASPEEGRAYRITAPGPVDREVVEITLLGGEIVEGGARAKLATLRQRLLGGDQRAIGIVVSAEGQGAHDAIADFLAAAGGVGVMVDRIPGMTD